MKTTTSMALKGSSLSLLVVSLLSLNILAYFGPSTVFATPATDSVKVTLNVDAGIAIDSPLDVDMSRHLSMSADTAVGSSTWTVTTNNVTGYNLTVKANTAPAMQQSATTSVADYQTSSPNTWSVSAGSAAFGFSAFGTNVNTSTWGSDTSCASSAHVPSTNLKYLGFTTSDSATVVANSVSTTTYSGSATTVCLAVQQNQFFIPSGTYSATITATAVLI
jgi:hypothetical protein